jgi:UDP-GlcNAc3NAcA epimerase
MVMTVVGARPQFIKASAVSPVLRASHREWLLHTGQHYDAGMSAQFFDELEIPRPDECLHVGSGSHAEQTSRMLVGIERAIAREQPDVVLVYGDTNSTLAGALAAAKLGVPVAHVEAGLRSFNRAMPEEINRVVTDALSNILFCPSDAAVANLANEGVRRNVHLVGDVMRDVLRRWLPRARERSTVLEKLGLAEQAYLLATIHRAGNSDAPERLATLMAALGETGETVVFPLHPRTRKALEQLDVQVPQTVLLIEPVGYLDMLRLQASARLILTDSGGVQKEACWLGVPCVTLRDETEWVETVQAGWNVLAGAEPHRILAAVQGLKPCGTPPDLYGDGHTADRIVGVLSTV